MLDSALVPLLQKKLQETLQRLRAAQREAEELEADIREKRTSWKVRGDTS